MSLRERFSQGDTGAGRTGRARQLIPGLSSAVQSILTLPGCGRWSHRSSSGRHRVWLVQVRVPRAGTDTGTGRYQADIDVGTGTRPCGGTDQYDMAPVDAF